jgi:Zn ribbon nucleic-acid-binding protein
MRHKTTATCDACGSNELAPARDELAADPRDEYTGLLECLACGHAVEISK